jgi:hypothetical protein
VKSVTIHPKSNPRQFSRMLYFGTHHRAANSHEICTMSKYTFHISTWATDWTIGVLGFDSRRRLGIFLFTTASRTALGPTQPPIQWVPGTLSLGVKRPGRETIHSPPSSDEVKERVELYLRFPSTPSWRVAWLKHRDNFTFYLQWPIKSNIARGHDVFFIRL